MTYTNPQAYELSGQAFSTVRPPLLITVPQPRLLILILQYGWESYPDPDNGYLTWQVNGEPAWQITSASVGPNAAAGIGQRLISNEPMVRPDYRVIDDWADGPRAVHHPQLGHLILVPDHQLRRVDVPGAHAG